MNWNVLNFVVSILGSCLNIFLSLQPHPYFSFMFPLVALLLAARAVFYGTKMLKERNP